MKAKHYLAAALLLTGLAACKKDKENDESMNAKDIEFVKNVSVGNHNEMDAGQLAGSKATDASVKAFGNMMVTEHQAAQNELKALASGKEISIQEGPDAAHINMKNQLMQMSGHRFDSAYIHSQVSDHQAVLNMFNDELNNGKDPDIKAFASKYKPHIQMHFNRADSTAKRF